MKAATFKDVNGFEIAFTDVLYSVGNKVCRYQTAFMGAVGLYEVDAETAAAVAAHIQGLNAKHETAAQAAESDERAEYTGNSRAARFLMNSLKMARTEKYAYMRDYALRGAWNVAVNLIAGTHYADVCDDCDSINGRPLIA